MAKTHPARSNGKRPGGRPTKYDPAYCQQIVEFIAARAPYVFLKEAEGDSGKIRLVRQANDPPLLVDFARAIGVSVRTIAEWGHAHPAFSQALEDAKALQERFYLTCGFLGLSNPTITALILKNNHGYRDKAEVEHSGGVVVYPPDWVSFQDASRLRHGSNGRAVPAAPHPSQGAGLGAGEGERPVP